MKAKAIEKSLQLLGVHTKWPKTQSIISFRQKLEGKNKIHTPQGS